MPTRTKPLLNWVGPQLAVEEVAEAGEVGDLAGVFGLLLGLEAGLEVGPHVFADDDGDQVVDAEEAGLRGADGHVARRGDGGAEAAGVGLQARRERATGGRPQRGSGSTSRPVT